MTRKLHILFFLLTFALFANATKTYTSESLLSSGKWVKIRVDKEGVYQLTASTLKSMGFSDPTHVRLYGYNYAVLPETNIQDIPDDLTEIPLFHASNGNYLFYSRGTTQWKRVRQNNSTFRHRNNPYTSYIYYFLTEDSSVTPAEFKKVDAKTTASATQTTYYAHSIIDDDAYSFLNCGRTFFESYDFAKGSIKSYTLPLVGVPTDNVSLTVQFGAANTAKSNLTVATNGKSLFEMTFTKLGEYQYANVSSLTSNVMDVTTNRIPITLTHTFDTGGGAATGHLDYIQACYPTTLTPTSSNYVAFTPDATGQVVFGISSSSAANLVLWNVTSPSKTCELSGTQTSTALNASVDSANIAELYVALDQTATYPSPEKVGTVANQNLHALKDINLLIIVPSNGKLTAQAQRLADAHSNYDKLNCAVVTADQVYNEFSSGTPDFTAYRRLAKMLYDRDSCLQNILLFGSCYWDNRFVTSGLSSKDPDDYLLVYESDNSWSHTDSYACEEYVALLDDGEGVSPLKEKPDAGVGRIPVTTELEAKQVVDKLIHYMSNQSTGAWKNTICIMGDDGNANLHMEDAEAVLDNTQELYPNYRYKRIYWDSYARSQSATGSSYPDAYNDINQTMDEGALIMNYTGHGAAYCLSHEQVLKTKDFQEWSSDNLPLWFTAACDVCPFDMNTENLACEALLNPNGAAMGFVSTARTVYSSPNRTLNKSFMKYVLGTSPDGERYSIGEALILAKCDILSKKNIARLDSLNKAQYVLMGDPAIHLITPTYTLKIDDISGDKTPDESDILTAGTETTISGHVEDEDGNLVDSYSGIVSPTVFDTEEHIICHDNDGSAKEAEKDPFDYYDRKRILYSGSDSIRSGKFTFKFIVPVDLNYGTTNGLMKLYAVNSSASIEANGTYSDFYVGDAGGKLTTDTIGPKITAWLNTPAFRDGLHVGTTPTLYATISDSCGINTTGNGIGHNIEAIIDNDESTTYSLNNYFTQKVGDYTTGSVTYTIPELTTGNHTLTLRAFDVFNNLGETCIAFYVYEGTETAVVYDMSGRKFSADMRTVLPPGVYVRKYTYEQDGIVIDERTEKVLVK